MSEKKNASESDFRCSVHHESNLNGKLDIDVTSRLFNLEMLKRTQSFPDDEFGKNEFTQHVIMGTIFPHFTLG